MQRYELSTDPPTHQHLFFYFLFLPREFHAVKPDAIDGTDTALGDEGMGIDLIDDAEDVTALRAARDDKEHAHGLAGVEAMGVDERAATVDLIVDGPSDLLPLVGDDKELDTAATAIDDIIHAGRHHEEYDIAVDHFLPTANDEIGRRNDRQVANQDDTSETDVAVFMHHRRNDITAAAAGVAHQRQAHAHTHQQSTNEAGQKGLVGKEGLNAARLQHGSHQREDTYGEDRAEAEFPSEDHQCRNQQDGIQREIRVLYGDADTPKYQGGDTGETADRDVMGQQKSTPPQRAEHHAESNGQQV